MEKWLYPVLYIKQLLLLALNSKTILYFKLYVKLVDCKLQVSAAQMEALLGGGGGDK